MNKYILAFFISLCLFSISKHAAAQTDSIHAYSKKYRHIVGNADWATGKIRGFMLGDSITTVLHFERAILEAQGDDFLYYRVLCDSTISAEISYTFDEKGLLVSIGIEFFELCTYTVSENLSDEFLINLYNFYKNCIEVEKGSFQCISETGVRIQYQKWRNEMCVIHTQIEFY